MCEKYPVKFRMAKYKKNHYCPQKTERTVVKNILLKTNYLEAAANGMVIPTKALAV